MHAYVFSSYCDPERDDKHLQIILKLFLQHVIENKTLPCRNMEVNECDQHICILWKLWVSWATPHKKVMKTLGTQSFPSWSTQVKK